MLLEVQNLTVGYARRKERERRLIEGLSLIAPEGRAIGLLGRNGMGKSTLLRVLAGVQRPIEGRVSVGGVDLAHLSAHDRACRIAFVTTEPVATAHLRVREAVAMGRAPYTGWLGSLSAEDLRRVDESLERVGMSAFADMPLDSLSDGERQRVMIARAVAQDTPIVLLDEPGAFLDLPNRYRMALLLCRLAHEMGKTVIYSSHDLSTAVQLCDLLWLLTPSGIVAGEPAELLQNGTVDVLFDDLPIRCLPDGVIRFDRLEDRF